MTLSGKVLYRDACNTRIAWDALLSCSLTDKWSKWEQNLPQQVSIPRTICQHHEKILSVDFHRFGDANAKGVSAAIYAVVKQTSGTSQGLVTAKSHLAKKGLTIPRSARTGMSPHGHKSGPRNFTGFSSAKHFLLA